MAGPIEDDYQACANLSNEANELVAMGRLGELLPLETDHGHLCQVGVWFWSLGHKRLAKMAYERSIALQPEAPTYFNLAVCCDDLEMNDLAKESLSKFYDLVSDPEEIAQVEDVLRQKGKGHLVRN